MSEKPSSNKKGKYQVILLDNNHSTFDHVIECLMEICGHNYYQAGQCATITHNNGRCSVFVDSYDECMDVFNELLDEDIKSVIQKYKTVRNDKNVTK
jgi:ATP-dependent Clp protease adaptor protein ClpS